MQNLSLGTIGIIGTWFVHYFVFLSTISWRFNSAMTWASFCSRSNLDFFLTSSSLTYTTKIKIIFRSFLFVFVLNSSLLACLRTFLLLRSPSTYACSTISSPPAGSFYAFLYPACRSPSVAWVFSVTLRTSNSSLLVPSWPRWFVFEIQFVSKNLNDFYLYSHFVVNKIMSTF